ncbi:nucleotide sugar dehydrogenase [Listeria newyorkensis]|uniref:Nucleotide sugar dehydrogenase n=1 Tax=Listeria newyorkensis TaxID=1497681 RepID=A0A841YUG6_9LIST|nr:nucleotide sugar dehydrogenase [Listeria newyorkensis]MBC1456935.1 nucleotide sugar dehydrogenase [Listeria newyorkensis]
MKIVTIGLGYIGLPTSIMFANHGQEVVGVDINPDVIDKLNQGLIHIEEPGLQEELERARVTKQFRASLEVEPADVFIVAVPTPNNDDALKSCNLDYVTDAVARVIPYLEQGNTIIIESTIAPKSTENVILPMIQEAGFNVGTDVFLVHCPERVLPGKIIHELVHNNRIIGGVTPDCTIAGMHVYSTFVKGTLIPTKAATAELSKLMENTFRDVNIALANELVKISTELGSDALEVIDMANQHPRVNLHQPGPGVGGHCLAVDPYFVAAVAPFQSPLIQQARQINNSMPGFVIEQTRDIMAKIEGKKIAVFGLTYKGNIDDIRESPAMLIYEKLQMETSFEIVAYDPHVQQDFVEASRDQALENADLVLVLTDHDDFKALDETALTPMKQPVIFDTKNCIADLNETVEHIHFGNIHSFRGVKETVSSK